MCCNLWSNSRGDAELRPCVRPSGRASCGRSVQVGARVSGRPHVAARRGPAGGVRSVQGSASVAVPACAGRSRVPACWGPAGGRAVTGDDLRPGGGRRRPAA
jgi:hypothetical protein